MEHRLQKTLTGQKFTPPAFWMMRQAGRYLPEYRQIREQAGSFWNLCFSPDLASEVTLQPIHRFDYDAAIIFSDILVIPKALGQHVDFAPNHGPQLGNLDKQAISQFSDWSGFDRMLTPVYQAISLTKSHLSSDKDLIGFAGSPWTIATYMIDGGKGHEFSLSRQSLSSVDDLMPLLETLIQAIARHLINQVNAGATVLQIFDSWAGLVPHQLRSQILFEPMNQIVMKVRSAVGNIPIIYFGRGVASSYPELVEKNPKIALGVDQQTDLVELDRILPQEIPLQGNLDPETLVSGGSRLEQEVKKILTVAKNRPFIFNLGHGILPHTPIAHVEQVCCLIRDFK